MPGRIKAGEGTLIGNAAEYYVMAELLSRGVIAALAPRNAPDFDILAAPRASNRTARVRAKARSHQHTDWQWNARPDGTIYRNISSDDDFVILVNLTPPGQRPEFLIIPTATVDAWLKGIFRQWVSHPGRHGQPHDTTNRHRTLSSCHHAPRLTPYQEAWDLLSRRCDTDTGDEDSKSAAATA